MGAQAKTVPCHCGEADCPGEQWACDFHNDRPGPWEGFGVAGGSDGVQIRALHWCEECHAEDLASEKQAEAKP